MGLDRGRPMSGGRRPALQRVCSGIALIIFLAMSVYLLVALVLALSDQGEPTNAPVPMVGAIPVYPNWYQAQEVLTAASWSGIVYPVAAVFYGVALLSAVVARTTPGRHPGGARAEADAAPRPSDRGRRRVAPGDSDDLCVLGAQLRILHVSVSVAQLFRLTPREMIGHSLEDFVAPGERSRLVPLLMAALADSGEAQGATIGMRQRDDAVTRVALTCRAATEAEACVGGALILAMRALPEGTGLEEQLAAIWY
jgi:PAS domain-containing protein